MQSKNAGEKGIGKHKEDRSSGRLHTEGKQENQRFFVCV